MRLRQAPAQVFLMEELRDGAKLSCRERDERGQRSGTDGYFPEAGANHMSDERIHRGKAETTSPSNEVTFGQVVCHWLECTPGRYEHQVFHFCAYQQHPWIIGFFKRVFAWVFEPDYNLIRCVEQATTFEQFESELQRFRAKHPPQGIWRGTFNLRLSTRKLYHLGYQLLPRKSSF